MFRLWPLLVPFAFGDMFQDYAALLSGREAVPKLSLVEVHLDQESLHTETSKKKRKKKVRDLDCDVIIADVDNIEGACHGRRFQVLVEMVPILDSNNRNMTNIRRTMSLINESLYGDPLTGMGLSELIDLQRVILYGGSNISDVALKTTLTGLVTDVKLVSELAFKLSSQTEGMMDTAWTNLRTLSAQLADFMGDHQTQKYLTAIAEGMAESAMRQQDLLGTVNMMKADLVRFANGLMTNISEDANSYQKTFVERLGKGKLAFEKLSKFFTTSVEKATAKLDEVTDLVAGQAPQRMADHIDKMTETGQSAIRKSRDEFFSSAHEKNAVFKSDIDKMASIFSKDSEGVILREQADWETAAKTQQTALVWKQRQLSRKTEDSASTVRLQDAKEMANMNDMATNLTDRLNTDIYASQDTVLKISEDLKKLKTESENVGRDVKSEFNNLLLEMTDGTVSQRDKISGFLKLAADSSASELAALVQSAARMRDSLGAGQSAAYAEISSLLSNLQVKLAEKAKEEANVSADVQRALMLGRDTSEAKIKAVGQYQFNAVDDAKNEIESSAADVVQWLAESALDQGNNGSLINRDMAAAAADGSAAISAKADLEREAAVSMISRLRALSKAGGEGASKSLNDAADAAKALLSSLSSLRSGASSLASLMADRSGVLGDKLAAIATQLGLSDDSAAKMFFNMMKSAQGDADTRITQLLGTQMANVHNQASKDGSSLSGIQGDFDSAEIQAEEAEKRALAKKEGFRAQLMQIAEGLDQQFGDRLSRDSAVRRAVEVGLQDTQNTLAGQAKRALEAVSSTRQALADDAVVQLGKDLSDFSRKVAEISKQQSDQISGSMNEIKGPAVADSLRTAAASEQAMTEFRAFFKDQKARVENSKIVLDLMKREFSKNSTEIANSVSGSDLGRFGTELTHSGQELVGFMKTVPTRISEQLKVIEDSFLSTEEQLASKAKLLEYMANKTMSEEEKKAMAHQLENLKKSQELMTDFRVVQKQALNEIFYRHTGLLGKADGTLGDLQKMAGSVSDMLNNNAQINDRVEQAIAKSRVDIDGMSAAMKNAVDVTNTSIARELDASNNQAAFSSNISSAQMSSLIDTANKDGNLASKTAEDISTSSEAAFAEKQVKLASLAEMLHANQQTMLEESQRAMNLANTTNDQFKLEIERNAADRDQQLMIVKNTVQRLLQTWAQYTDTQNRKFFRWNQTEDEYVGQFMGTMQSMNQSVRDKLAETGGVVSGVDSASRNAIFDFVTIRNKLASSIEQTRNAIQALNVTTEQSADQVGEQIYQLDANDKSLDDQARASAASEASSMESQADSQAFGVLDSLKVQIPAAVRGSLIETPDNGEAEDEALRGELESLEQDVNLEA
jgi:hypothetical protein